MNAMSADKITDPRDLYAPDATEEQIQHLLREHLSAEGRETFLSELMSALRAAQTEGDLGHINKVVEAWTRTALIVNEDFQDKWDAAQRDSQDAEGDTLTLKEIKARLDIS
jgi:hypothetical protein